MAELDDETTALVAATTANTSATASATAVIDGISAAIAAAVQTALAAGATREQLQAITAVQGALDANTASLATAVTANTPAA